MSETTTTKIYWIARAQTVDVKTGERTPITLSFRAADVHSLGAGFGRFYWAHSDYAQEYRFNSRSEAVAVARNQPGPDTYRPSHSEITIEKITRRTSVTIEAEPAITAEEFGER